MADAQKTPSSDQQTRLMIWTVPRSIATGLSKCLSFVDNSKAFYEPYFGASSGGPDSPKPEFGNAVVAERFAAAAEQASKLTEKSGVGQSQLSFNWVREQLEGAHDGSKFIFCKEMAFIVTDHLEAIPRGYRHLFFIRHPMKVFPSWKKSTQPFLKLPLDAFRLDDLPPTMVSKGLSFGELSELFDHVKEVHDQESIIIDADDLLQDPKGILSAVFETIGLPFEEKILHWEAGDAVLKQWVISKEFLQANQIGQFYKDAMDSTCFLKPHALPDRSSLSPEILQYVDASMPYYEKLYTQRLTAY